MNTMKASIYNTRVWVTLKSQTYTERTILQLLLHECEFNILSFTEHFFEPHGYTALWLLGESHLAIHTWPESNQAYIELSSCNVHKHNHFVNLLNEYFVLSDKGNTVNVALK